MNLQGNNFPFFLLMFFFQLEFMCKQCKLLCNLTAVINLSLTFSVLTHILANVQYSINHTPDFTLSLILLYQQS